MVISASDAQAALMDGQYNDEVAALPPMPADGNWLAALNALLGDRHINWHLTPGYTPEWLGDAPTPSSWFEPFPNIDPRPAHRGFRR
ncbi:hypothetical protein [Mycolicibacterium sp.]|uniref:hypothetical protein n=1 Tax=Mycolicibacterium sp. TaxID=2320850 RepID=UPI0037C54CCC